MLRSPRVLRNRIYKNVKLLVVQGDITDENVDAIVNAANEYLAHGGGVAGAISRRGGYKIQEESDEYVRKHGRVHTGHVGVTGPGNLRCKFVIHAVGPVYSGNKIDDEELESAVYQSFFKANELKLQNISIPAISSGIFGYPKPRCAKVMFKTAKKFVDDMEALITQGSYCSLNEIRFTNFDSETAQLLEQEFDSFFENPEKEIVLGDVPKKSYSPWHIGSWSSSKNETKHDDLEFNRSKSNFEENEKKGSLDCKNFEEFKKETKQKLGINEHESVKSLNQKNDSDLINKSLEESQNLEENIKVINEKTEEMKIEEKNEEFEEVTTEDKEKL